MADLEPNTPLVFTWRADVQEKHLYRCQVNDLPDDIRAALEAGDLPDPESLFEWLGEREADRDVQTEVLEVDRRQVFLDIDGRGLEVPV